MRDISPNSTFGDILDVASFKPMLEKLHKLTDISVAIVDTKGNVLAAVGWQRICTDFHRRNPESRKLCIQSDALRQEELKKNIPLVSNTCPHGLIEDGCSINVGDNHLANFYIGQFFHSPLTDAERAQFRKQADRYGFDVVEYLRALEEVPVVSREQHETMIGFLTILAERIAKNGLVNQQLQRQYEKTRIAEERYRLTFAAIEEGVWDWILGKSEIIWSEYCYTLLGYRVMEFYPTPDTWKELCHPADYPRLEQGLEKMVRQKQPFAMEFRLRRKDGSYCWLKGRGKVVETDAENTALRAVGTFLDITRSKTAEGERDEMEAQLRHAQKMEAIGTLAGGIAHDFNNILGPVIGYTDMVIRELPQDSPWQNPMNQIWQAGHRAQELVNQILTFGRKSTPEIITLYP